MGMITDVLTWLFQFGWAFARWRHRRTHDYISAGTLQDMKARRLL